MGTSHRDTGWVIGFACRGMAAATSLSSIGNFAQVFDGRAELLPAAIGAMLAAAVNIALIGPVERGRWWARPTLLLATVLWLFISVLVETEAGVYVYASFGSIYVTILGSISSRNPGRWSVAGGAIFMFMLLSRQASSPLASLAEPAEGVFTAFAGGVATWAVSAWVNRILYRLRSVNAELEEARDDAVQANQVKDRFLANMSHELRTPLTAIRGYADLLLEDGQLDSGATQDVRAIRGAAHHLTDLLTALLDLSRIDAGEREVTMADIEVASLVDDVVRTAQPLASAASNVLIKVVGPDLGRATTDGTMVRQILLNLVGNACKFTEHGQITVEAHRESDQLYFVVADTGIGIPADRLSAVFDRFVQADNSATRRHDGVGLGLALVHRLCEMLGGTVEVESSIGVGTTFHVRLPLEFPVSAEEGPVLPAVRATGTSRPREA